MTLTDADWFNDADFLIYDLFGDSTTTASAAARLAPSFNNLTVAGTLSVSAQATVAGLTVGGVLSTSALAAVQALQVAGLLSVSGTAAVQSLQVAGALSVSALAAVQSLQVAGTLSVSASAAVQALQVAGLLSVSALAAVQSLQVAGTLSVSAASTFRAIAATDISASAVAGLVVATQANMESAASAGSTSLIVTPGRLQYHPGVAKAWVLFDGSATSVTAAAGYNITAVTRGSTGNYTVSLEAAFTSSAYAVMGMSNQRQINQTVKTASSVTVQVTNDTGTAVDAASVMLAFFGDQ